MNPKYKCPGWDLAQEGTGETGSGDGPVHRVGAGPHSAASLPIRPDAWSQGASKETGRGQTLPVDTPLAASWCCLRSLEMVTVRLQVGTGVRTATPEVPGDRQILQGVGR